MVLVSILCFTFPETNSKMDAWNTFSFPFGPLAYFQGLFLAVSFREYMIWKKRLALTTEFWSIHLIPRKLHSGKLTWLAGKWTRIEDVFPIENDDFPASYVSLPEGNGWNLRITPKPGFVEGLQPAVGFFSGFFVANRQTKDEVRVCSQKNTR